MSDLAMDAFYAANRLRFIELSRLTQAGYAHPLLLADVWALYAVCPLVRTCHRVRVIIVVESSSPSHLRPCGACIHPQLSLDSDA